MVWRQVRINVPRFIQSSILWSGQTFRTHVLTTWSNLMASQKCDTLHCVAGLLPRALEGTQPHVRGLVGATGNGKSVVEEDHGWGWLGLSVGEAGKWLRGERRWIWLQKIMSDVFSSFQNLLASISILDIHHQEMWHKRAVDGFRAYTEVNYFFASALVLLALKAHRIGLLYLHHSSCTFIRGLSLLT